MFISDSAARGETQTTLAETFCLHKFGFGAGFEVWFALVFEIEIQTCIQIRLLSM